MADIESLIHRVIEQYKAAVYAKDAAAFMKLYDPKVRVFDAWGVWSYEGSAAWQMAVEAWLASLNTERVKVSFDDLQLSGSADLALASAIVTYEGVAADGQHLRSMHNRLSWVLRTSGHVLRIVHEHTSAPLGFDDSKAILVRDKHA